MNDAHFAPVVTCRMMHWLACSAAAFAPSVPVITAIFAPRQVVNIGQNLALSIRSQSRWRRPINVSAMAARSLAQRRLALLSQSC